MVNKTKIQILSLSWMFKKILNSPDFGKHESRIRHESGPNDKIWQVFTSLKLYALGKINQNKPCLEWHPQSEPSFTVTLASEITRN